MTINTIKYITKIISLTVSGTVSAMLTIALSVSLLALNLSSSTAVAHEDPYPFYEKVLMPAGPFKGLAVNTKHMRTMAFLDYTEFTQVYPISQDYYLIGNFYHNGKLYIAKVPSTGGEKMSLVFDYFTKKNATAHVMVMFEFSKDNPVELLAEVPTRNEYENNIFGKPLNESIKLDKILFSPEAVSIDGVSFSAKRGLKEQFVLAYRVLSLESRPESTKDEKRGRFEVNVLKTDAQIRKDSFSRAIVLSVKNDMEDMYHTLKNNCVNNSLHVIGWPEGTQKGSVAETFRLFPYRVKLEMRSSYKKRPRIEQTYNIDRIAKGKD